MTANELRLGNWIESYMVMTSGTWYDLQGNKHGVEKITEPIIRQVQVDLEILKIIEHSKGLATYRGIPLTPKILEQCGFETNCHILNINDNWFIGWQGYIYLQIEKYIKQEEDVCERIEFNHIQYLHQLQNLYFSLTGKELEYSPKTKQQ